MNTSSIQIVAIPERCYRCGEVTRGIAGILVPSGLGPHRTFHEFDDVARMLSATLDARCLQSLGIGSIKKRRSRVRGWYLSNGCVHCDAILGSFPLREALLEYLGDGGEIADLVLVA